MASRLKFCAHWIGDRRALRDYPNPPTGDCVAALFGYWDWSFAGTDPTGALVDRYFGRLPAVMRGATGRAVLWFTWFSPRVRPRTESLSTVVEPLRRHHDVVHLQHFVKTREAIGCALSPRTLLALGRAFANAGWRRAFRHGDIDCLPLFWSTLWREIAGVRPALQELAARATERATRRYQPMLVFEFQEMFTGACAHYEGIRRAQSGAVRCAVVHGGYSHDTGLAMIDPIRDLGGEPDGCPMPRPDVIYTMGELTRRVFVDCGFATDNVTTTGAPRYSLEPAGVTRSRSSAVRLLVLTTLAEEIELDLMEAAVEAARGLDFVTVTLRPHPFFASRFESLPRFQQLAAEMKPSSGTLADALADTDVVLFSYTTAADEAFATGMPVWQWSPLGFNGSGLAEATGIPRFTTVRELRDALTRFHADSAAWIPSRQSVDRAVAELFGFRDDRAAERIVDDALARVGMKSRTLDDATPVL
jgi:hypothetical protein